MTTQISFIVSDRDIMGGKPVFISSIVPGKLIEVDNY